MDLNIKTGDIPLSELTTYIEWFKAEAIKARNAKRYDARDIIFYLCPTVNSVSDELLDQIVFRTHKDKLSIFVGLKSYSIGQFLNKFVGHGVELI